MRLRAIGDSLGFRAPRSVYRSSGANGTRAVRLALEARRAGDAGRCGLANWLHCPQGSGSERLADAQARRSTRTIQDRGGGSVMSKRFTLLVLCLVVASLPQAAHAGDDFASFCSEWMGKLAQRERDNLKSAQARQGAGGVVLEYTGYGSEP